MLTKSHLNFGGSQVITGRIMNGSPTFVAHFADGEVTRMTTYCDDPKKLDQQRGVRLARHAYRSRCKKEPPVIVKASFECKGAVLAEYTAEQLALSNPYGRPTASTIPAGSTAETPQQQFLDEHCAGRPVRRSVQVSQKKSQLRAPSGSHGAP